MCNLRAHPGTEVQIGRARGKVRAREAIAEDRGAWKLMAASGRVQPTLGQMQGTDVS